MANVSGPSAPGMPSAAYATAVPQSAVRHGHRLSPEFVIDDLVQLQDTSRVRPCLTPADHAEDDVVVGEPGAAASGHHPWTVERWNPVPEYPAPGDMSPVEVGGRREEALPRWLRREEHRTLPAQVTLRRRDVRLQQQVGVPDPVGPELPPDKLAQRASKVALQGTALMEAQEIDQWPRGSGITAGSHNPEVTEGEVQGLREHLVEALCAAGDRGDPAAPHGAHRAARAHPAPPPRSVRCCAALDRCRQPLALRRSHRARHRASVASLGGRR